MNYFEITEDESFLCRWRDCLFSSDSHADMVRHINFHTFHTQLKSEGADTIKKLNLNYCKRVRQCLVFLTFKLEICLFFLHLMKCLFY